MLELATGKAIGSCKAIASDSFDPVLDSGHRTFGIPDRTRTFPSRSLDPLDSPDDEELQGADKALALAAAIEPGLFANLDVSDVHRRLAPQRYRELEVRNGLTARDGLHHGLEVSRLKRGMESLCVAA